MGTVPQYRRETDQPRTRMLGLLLILPGLLTAAPASLTKHVVKAPSPIYTAPVYNEHTGQGINHGYGQGLGFGHGQGAAYGQGYANGAHVTPCWPVHWKPPALPSWRAVPAAACLPGHPVPRLSLPRPRTQDCKHLGLKNYY